MSRARASKTTKISETSDAMDEEKVSVKSSSSVNGKTLKRSKRSAKNSAQMPEQTNSTSSASSAPSVEKKKTTKKRKKSKPVDDKVDDEDNGDEEDAPPVKKTTKKQRTTAKVEKNSKITAKADEDESNSDEGATRKKRKSTKKAKTSKKKKSKNNSNDEAEVDAAEVKDTEYVNLEFKPSSDGKVRCWSSPNKEMWTYHDAIWGLAPLVPAASSSSSSSSSSSNSAYSADEVSPYISLSEYILAQMGIQTFQAGISWRIVFAKRHSISSAFCHYSLSRLPLFGSKDVDRLMQDASIIRNKRKIEAVINNAQQALRIEKRESKLGGFGCWLFSQPFIMNMLPKERLLATGKHLSSHMRQDGFKVVGEGRFESDGVHPTDSVTKLTGLLKQEGFKHLGETSILSFMQAIGMMNHHANKCHIMEVAEQRWKKLMQFVKTTRKIK